MSVLKTAGAILGVCALSGCLNLGTSIGVGSGGVSGGVVLSGSTEIGNGVTVGTSVGKGF